ncbi:MAG: putative ABC transporter ATP-binding protein YbhF [Verrucomicrobia subdivision 3 bacterium]|nr:putative ABC transporter ATP-binding protein YbhF [Limisphaerales bacterium]MCS1415683.1 putative ABC transporter ATP-binding protein YbhF [Limisphaerales bacterium]
MIKVENLKKAFGPKFAVNGVSFSVERGEVLGFLGPNGAGKSTTMRMITGFIPPTNGRVTVGGFDIIANPIEAKRLIGYLPENAPAYSDMTVHSFLSFSAEIRGLSGRERSTAIERVIDLCFLDSVVQQSVDTLSKGYRHRTCFAQSIIHDPDILILDEPTDGLDPNQKHEVRSIIKRMGEKKAIIFSTHILEEVEAVCSRAIIVDRGQIVADGTPDQLKLKSPNAGAVFLKLRGAEASAAKERLAKIGPVDKVLVLEDGDTITLKLTAKESGNSGDLAASVADAVNQARWRIEELRTEEGKLDEVFRSITKPDTAKKEAA